MSNHSVISALLAARFEYLGVICCENLLIALNNSEVWGLDCVGESDTDNRWNDTRKMIRTALKQIPMVA